MRERYEDNPSTYPDFDPDVWIKVGSSDGPNRNRVHELLNTTVENLCMTRSFSTVGSLQSVSSTQSQEFAALQQHTTLLTKKIERLSANYEYLLQIVMDMRSQMGGTCASLFGRIVPGTTSLLLLLLCLHYSIFFYTIFFINYFLFLFNFFLIITDRYTDRHNPLIYSREFETIYFICHYNIVTSLTE